MEVIAVVFASEYPYLCSVVCWHMLWLKPSQIFSFCQRSLLSFLAYLTFELSVKCSLNWYTMRIYCLLNLLFWWTGADVNLKNEGGRTALHYAASKGRVKVAEILLSNGAKVNLKDKVCNLILLSNVFDLKNLIIHLFFLAANCFVFYQYRLAALPCTMRQYRKIWVVSTFDRGRCRYWCYW